MAIFQEQVKECLVRYREKTAIEYGFDSLTYGELDEQSDYVCHDILEAGIKPGSFIALLMNNQLYMASFIVGILKAGCVFVPLDISYPVKRLKDMIQTCDINYVFSDCFKRPMLFEETDMAIFYEIDENFFDNKRETLKHQVPKHDPEDMIYVYFTSGTTGQPKAIVGKNKSLLHFINWEIENLQLDETVVVSQLTSPCHDPWLRDVFVALFAGGRVCIPEKKEIILESGSFVNWLELSRISLIHCTPSLFQLMNNDFITGSNLNDLKYILMAGEKIIPASLAFWYEKFGDRVTLINLYGSTETTMVKTFYRIKPEDIKLGSIPIGKPMRGARVIILDQDLNICMPGDPGEIYIRTPYRTHGYYNNSALNQQKFISNPFNSDPDDLIYRTGDIGRIRPDGELEYIGRIDRQVKIRGIRVELEEIENVLTRHEKVSAAALNQAKTANDEYSLFAYVVLQKKAAETEETYKIEKELYKFLEQQLPSAMLPSHIILLESFPMTASQKIDYKALPLPQAQFKENPNYRAPKDDLEKKIIEIAKEILRREAISMNDNFMQIGGHSLNVMTLVTRIYQELGVELSLGRIFEDATLVGIADYIRTQEASSYITIEYSEENEEGIYPVSFAQRRQYILHEIEGHRTNYNITDAKHIEGSLDIERFKNAYHKLMLRHDSFRTSFLVKDSDIMQRISKEAPESLHYIELKGEAAKASGEEVRRLISAFIRPFDLKTAPLIRSMLIRLNEKEHVFVYDMHHIISDERSVDIFTRELILLYRGEELPELPFQYRDFAVWQSELLESGKLNRQKEYWLDLFQDQENLPILNMPQDFPRPAVQQFKGRKISFSFDEELTLALNNLAVMENTTLYIVLLTVLNSLLYRYTDQEDIIIGSPIAGRMQAGLENIIGMFVNTIPMRNHPKGSLYFRDFLEIVKRNTYQAFENQDYPFEEIINQLNLKKDLSRGVLFDVMFVLHNMYGDTITDNEVKYYTFPFETQSTKLDMTISAVEINNQIFLELEYATSLYTEDAINRFMKHFKVMAEAVCRNASVTLEQLPFITLEDREAISRFNSTNVPYDREVTVHELFEYQAAMTPNRIAVITPSENLTYREINQSANSLACKLHKMGVGPNKIVAIVTERSQYMIIGILAILKAGGAYLPVSTDYPDDRIAYILIDSKAVLVLAQESEVIRLNAIMKDTPIINLEALENYTDQTAAMKNWNSSEDIVYVIYTSGSTGSPKGVLIQHNSVVNRLNWMKNKYSFGQEDTILQKTTYCFDVSVFEIFLWFFTGARVCLLKPGGEKNPKDMIQAIDSSNIKIIHFVPSMLDVFLDYVKEACQQARLSSLEHIIVSGEELTLQVRDKLYSVLGRDKVQLHNFYGPTEATIDVTYYDCSSQNSLYIIPIGKPIDNTRIIITDKNGNQQPIGVPGELCIAGDNLARGYLNNEELTHSKFVYSTEDPSERIYQTGDLARWLNDGNIEFLGRMDNQVKIRGFRVELGEIEKYMRDFAPVRQAVAVVDSKQNINAYYVAEQFIDARAIRQYMLTKLPSYMIPAFFFRISKLPLNASGKCERKLLHHYIMTEEYNTENMEEVTELQSQLVLIWEKIIGIKNIQCGDNFFEIGGNSLHAIKLEVEMEKIGYTMEAADIFKYQTLREFADSLENQNQSTRVVPVSADHDYAAQNLMTNAISNIGIFNEFRYRSCFYNAIFGALLCIDRSVMPVLINDVFVYSYRDQLQLRIDYRERYPLIEVLEKHNIASHLQNNTMDMIETIKASVDSGSPIVIAIDSFYEPIRKDTYQKMHWPHYLLIYGYDEQRKTIAIIEHLHRESLSYDKRELSYDDILRCYNSYMENYASPNEPTIISFSLIKKERNKNLRAVYRKNYFTHLAESFPAIKQGIVQFEVFLDDLQIMLTKEKELFQNTTKLTVAFNEIIEMQKVEYYKYSNLFRENHRIMEVLKELENYFVIIRKILLKYEISQQYPSGQISQCKEHLQAVKERGREYLQCILYEIENSEIQMERQYDEK